MWIRRRETLTRICVATISFLGLAACATSAGVASGSNSSSVIKLGFIAERTGTFASYGIPSYNGTVMAVDKLNKAGGVTVNGKKYTFQIDLCDDNSQDNLVAQCAYKLVRDDKVKFLFGAIGPLAPTVAKIADPAGVMYFTPASAASPLLPTTKLMMQTLPPVEQNAQLTVKAITQIMPNVKRVAIIGESDNDQQTIEPQILAAMKADGLDVVADEHFDPTATDLSGQLTRIRAAHPDLLFIGWNASLAGLMLNQAAQLQAAPAIATWSIGCEFYQGSNYKGKYIGNDETGLDVTYSDTPAAKTFAAEYRAEFNPKAGTDLSAGLINYDFVGMLGQAMEKAGTTDDAYKVLPAIQSITYHGLYGTIRFVNRQVDIGLDFCVGDNGQVTGARYIAP
jgi:branched-chain amino acid transport system substrate-binding protein